MIRSHICWSGILFALSVSLMWPSTVTAAVNPYTETFGASAANWYNPLGTAPATWVANGGPDGSPHISTIFNFKDLTPGLPFPNNAVNLFRAQDEFNSSNHAFEGNWIADGVMQLSFDVRHDAPGAMMFFVRFSAANNFPAWSGVEFAAASSNVWTHISIPISLSNPNLFFEGPPGGLTEFNAVFGNIGHVQIGAFAGGMAGVDQAVNFDLDNVSITPGPGALSVVGMMLSSLGSRRRQNGGGSCILKGGAS